MTPPLPNYESISVIQEDPEEVVNSGWTRIDKRKLIIASAVLIVGLSLAVVFGHASSPFFLYGPLLGPYLDGNGAKGRRKAIKALVKLGKELEGDVLFVNDATFCDAAEVWQQGLGPPLAVVEVESEADVQLAVPVLADIYLKYGVPFRVRSGGHSYAGYSTIEGGVVLALGRLNEIKFDETTGVATIQPAVQVQDLLDSILVPFGFGGVTGECPGVCEGGFVLGGGYGFLSRKYGIGSDSILGARVVLVDGSVVVASETKAPDLFWALRGAGQNSFGVVTQLDYQLHPSQDTQLIFSGEIPLDAAFLTAIGKKWIEAPGEFGFLLEGTVNKHGITDGLLSWFGKDDASLDDGEQYIKEEILSLLPGDAADRITADRTSWSEMTKAGGNFDGNLVRAWTGYLMEENNTEAVWSKIIKKLVLACTGNPYLLLDLELWGGAIAEKEPEDTAFYYRKAVFNVGLLLLVPSDVPHAKKIYRETIAEVDRKWKTISQHLEGVYTNYIQESLTANEYARAYWGGNVEKLQRIKDKYDRQEVFHHPQSIPPAHPIK